MPSLHAVVTGASSGIGAATVKRLTDEGWLVTAVARRRDRLEYLSGRTGCAIVCADITQPDDVAELARVVTMAGPVNALVNNAGGAIGFDEIATSDPAAWSRQFEVNVVGTVRVTPALL